MQIYLFVTQSDLNISITDLYKRYMSFIIVHQVTKSIIKTQQNAYKVRSLTQSLRDNSLSSCTISLVAVKKPLSSDQHFAVLKPEPLDGLIECSITLKFFDLYPHVCSSTDSCVHETLHCNNSHSAKTIYQTLRALCLCLACCYPCLMLCQSAHFCL